MGDLLQGHPLWLKLLHGLQPTTPRPSGTGPANNLHPHHQVVQQIISHVCGLCEQLSSGSFQVVELQQLQDNRHALAAMAAAVQLHQQSVVPSGPGCAEAPNPSSSSSSISGSGSGTLDEHLAVAAVAVQSHEQQRARLAEFYNTLCPAVGATADLESYVADLGRMEAEVGSFIVKELASEGVWGMHWPVLEAAEDVWPILGTVPFANSLKLFAAAKAADLSAATAAAGARDCAGLDQGNAVVAEADGCSSNPAAAAAAAAAADPAQHGADSSLLVGPGPVQAVQGQLTVSEACQAVPEFLEDFAARWAAATGTPNSSFDTGFAGASAAAGSRSVSDLESPSAADVLALWVSERMPDVEEEHQRVQQYLLSRHQGPAASCPGSSSSSSTSSSSTCTAGSQAHTHVAAVAAGGSRSAAALPPSAISALLRLHHSSREGPLGEVLEAVQSAFHLSPSPLLTAAQQLPKVLGLEVQVPALALAAAFEQLESGLGALAGQVGLLQQLGRSAALQEFLASTSADDLRRLVDGAEDHGDSFVRSAVLSDLLEVNRLLQQLMPLHNAATLEQLLHKVLQVAEAAAAHQAAMYNRHCGAAAAAAPASAAAAAGEPVAAACTRMAAQLQVCNESVHSFKALYSRLATDRAELTREVVIKVMQQGTYTFTALTAEGEGSSSTAGSSTHGRIGSTSSQAWQITANCSYPRSSEGSCRSINQELTLADLQDLRSRVMLLSGSSGTSSSGGRKAAFTPAASGAQPLHAVEAAAQSEALLSAFVDEVSTAGEVVAAASHLLELGCFSYHTWQHQLTAMSEEPLQRPQQQQQLLAALRQDLQQWEQQLAEAQAQCWWLNFFQPRQLFILREALCPGVAVTAVQQQACFSTGKQQLNALDVLRFADPALQQPEVDCIRSRTAAAGTAVTRSFWAKAVNAVGNLLDPLVLHGHSSSSSSTSASSRAPLQLPDLSPAVQHATAVLNQLAAALDALLSNADKPAAPASPAAAPPHQLPYPAAASTAGNSSSSSGPLQPVSLFSQPLAQLDCMLEETQLNMRLYSFGRNVVPVAVKDESASSIGLVLYAHISAGCAALRPSEVVFCSSKTSWWEVQLLMQRCFPLPTWIPAATKSAAVWAASSESGASSWYVEQQQQQQQGICCLCEADMLPLSLQSQLVQLLLKIGKVLEPYECVGTQQQPRQQQQQQHSARLAGQQGLDAENSTLCHGRLLITCSSPCCLLVSQLAQLAATASPAVGMTVAAAPVAPTGDSLALPLAAEQPAWLQVQHVQQGVRQAALGQLLQHVMQQQGCCVVVLTSDLPGQGKTSAAACLARAVGKQLYHLLLLDDLSGEGDVISQLQSWDPTDQVLHVQLLSCSSPAAVEQLLFNLLVLSHVADGLGAYHRPPGPCYVAVEVGNSIGEGLLQQMPMLAAAQQLQQLQVLCRPATAAPTGQDGTRDILQAGVWRLHCSFCLAHVDTATANAQLLCTYLALQGANVLDTAAVGPDGTAPGHQRHAPGTAAACQQLLQQAFVAGREGVMSYTLLNTFVSVAARQLRHMAGCCFFQPEVLQWIGNGAASRVRSQLLTAILDAACTFAVDSCSAVRSKQRQQQQQGHGHVDSAAADPALDTGLQLANRGGSIVGWSDSNHLLLLFNAKDQHQSITALYRDRQHVPSSFQQLLASQELPRSGGTCGLVDYTAMGHRELLDVLFNLVQQPAEAAAAQHDPGAVPSTGVAGSSRLSSSSSSSTVPAASLLDSPYTLTADNLLKMALIYLRVQCGLPVVMMGDTGCGKTSLLKFLAAAAGVQLHVLNVHAGTTSHHIMLAVERAEQLARGQPGQPVWLFLDEANTCCHQGLLASLISHRQLPGNRLLHPAVVPLAAVNPYRLKPTLDPTSSSSSSSAAGNSRGGRSNRRSSVAATAGLTGKLPAAYTGLGRLVYTVQPLPETVMDHAWDFGVLSPADEVGYIAAMVKQAAARCCSLLPQHLLVDALCCSQRHIRSCGQAWDVSLRDVLRCIRLASWFETNMRNRPKPRRKNPLTTWWWNSSHLGSWGAFGSLLPPLQNTQQQQQQQQMRVQLQGLVLALLHTYHSRLADRGDRQRYLELLAGVFRRHGRTASAADLAAILLAEQEDYLKRMELPASVAVNEALRENVFMALVCILNRVPLFLVGKPGSSKSLALRLIHANLRGPDSSDDFFRQLPTLVFFSYQGSESSTSEGITRTFQAAREAAAAAAGPGTIAVVLLDEVGLAEVSPHNPLKALHAQLEPGYPAEVPDVAVVGISNWALDAAKMSRAVLLARPEPQLPDLAATATTMWKTAHATEPDAVKTRQLAAVAAAYHAYYNSQAVQDFHGLRDYYGLIKSLRLHPQLSPAQLYRALLRNFGGPEELVQQVIASFSQLVIPPLSSSLPSVSQLIYDNLQDTSARHLLLISSGDIAVDVVRHSLQQQGPAGNHQSQQHDVAVVWGSPWKEDQSDVYKYSLLSRIILHMELGHTLVLRDAGIFGALYDMFNQNYSTVGGRHNCRIALGPYSNPMCAVHERFRAIVVMTPAQAAAADPSLLNRFEKQWLDCSQLLPITQQQLLLRPLQQWLEQLVAVNFIRPSSSSSSSSNNGTQGGFGSGDLFLGLHSDSLPSLLLKLFGAGSSSSSSRSSSSRGQSQQLADPGARQQLLGVCQQALAAVASLDGVARVSYGVSSSSSSSMASSSSSLLPGSDRHANYLVASFLAAPKHSIKQFVQHQLTQHAQHKQLQQGCVAASLENAAAAGSVLSSPAAVPGDAAGVAAAPVAAAAAAQPLAIGLWYVVTRSEPHVAVAPLLQQLADVHELFLEQIRSEKELRQQLQQFLAHACSSSSGSSNGSSSGGSLGPTGVHVASYDVTAPAGGNLQPARLLVFHAQAPAAAAELRHLRQLVVDVVSQAGIAPAAYTPLSAASAAAATSSVGEQQPAMHTAGCSTRASDEGAVMKGKPALTHLDVGTSRPAVPPLVAVCIVVHVPLAAAAARVAAASQRQAAPPEVHGKPAHRTAANTAVGEQAGKGDDAWQCSWLSDWQQVTVDSLEGIKPWLWEALCCSLAPVAKVSSSNAAAEPVASIAVAALPLQQMMQAVLLRTLCSLPYPNTRQGAARVKDIAGRLLSPAGAGLWSALHDAVRSSMLRWAGWQQQGLLQLAGDVVQLQLHGSLAAVAEAMILDEISRQLGLLLLGLEQHHVLDAYWTAGIEMQQMVHHLLVSARFTSVQQQQQQQQPAGTAIEAIAGRSRASLVTGTLQPLQLQLPISGLCYQCLQARCGSYEELLQCTQASAGDCTAEIPRGKTAAAAAAAAPSVGGADQLQQGDEAATLGSHSSSSSSSSSNSSSLLYRLDALLFEALGDEMAAVLKQHPAEYSHDLLMLALSSEGPYSSQQHPSALAAMHTSHEAAGRGRDSSSTLSMPAELQQQLQNLLLLSSCRTPELHGVQHPLVWQLLAWQHRQQLSAFASIVACSAAISTTAAGSATCSDAIGLGVPAGTLQALHAVVDSMYHTLLPTEACLAATGGVHAWRSKCSAALAQAAALHTLLPCRSQDLLQNLEVLVQLVDAVIAQHSVVEAAAAAGGGCQQAAAEGALQQLAKQLHSLAVLLQPGGSIVRDAVPLKAALDALHLLLLPLPQQQSGRGSSSSSSNNSTQQDATKTPSTSGMSFVAWLLSCSLKALAESSSLAVAAAPSDTGSSSTAAAAAAAPSRTLQLIVDQVLGRYCSACLLPQLVQVLRLSVHHAAGQAWQQLLENVQLLGRGQQFNSCPVWCCLHEMLKSLGCGPDDAPVALLALAVQQTWFGHDVVELAKQQQLEETISAGQEQWQQEVGFAAAWVERAAAMLCKAQVPLLQLAVAVAFLRAVVDAVAPGAVATAAAAMGQSHSDRSRSSRSSRGSDRQCGSAAPDLTLLSAVGRSLCSQGAGSTCERLHSLQVYLLKAMRGNRAFAELQQLCQAIAQQPSHPLQQCMAGLFAQRPTGQSPQQQQQMLLPLDPFTQLPYYQQIVQLLDEAATWPASAAGLLGGKLRQAATCSATARAFLAAVSRRVYLVRGLEGSGQQVAAQQGLVRVCDVLVQMLKEAPLDALIRQLLLTMLTNSWHPHGSSSSAPAAAAAGLSGSHSRGLLQLGARASQQQLYVCSAVLHLALGLLTTQQAAPVAAAGVADSAAAAAAAGSARGFAAPLLNYLTNPAASRQHFMLGMPGDEAMQLLNSIATAVQGTTTYRCRCGMPYLIGDCGRPAQQLRCPSQNCPYSLGGTSHTPASGQTLLGNAGSVAVQQQRGFINTFVATDAHGSSRGLKPGGASESTAVLSAAAVSVRSLHPSSCQLLRLLVHAALLVGSAAQLQPPGALSTLLGVADDAEAQRIVTDVLLQQWQLLRQSCQATEEQLLAVVHCTIDALLQVDGSSSSTSGGGAFKVWQLSSEAERQAWELQFQEQLSKRFVKNPTSALQQLLAGRQAALEAAAGLGTAAATAGAYIECAVQEVLCVDVDSAYRSQHLPTLFRSIQVPSLEALGAHFWANPQNAAHYPVTAAVLQEVQQQQLALLPHLAALVSFEAAFRQRYSGAISRASARDVPLAKYVTGWAAGGSSKAEIVETEGAAAAGSDVSGGCVADAGLSVQHFKQFIQAWNAVGPITTRHECKDITIPATTCSNAVAAVACLSARDDVRLLLAMLAELAERHNNFLTACQQQQQQDGPFLKDQSQQGQEGQGQQLPAKPVQAVRPADIINVPGALQQLQHTLSSPGSGRLAWPGLAYATGQTLMFDLAAVERLLHSCLVAGMCQLDASSASLQEFVFQGEVFLASATLLHDVELRMGQQQDMPAQEAAALAAALLKQLPPGTAPASLLAHLELLLSFLQRTGGSPTSSVADYVSAWLPDGPTRQLLHSCQLLQLLQLQQLVGLYEAVEDSVAAAIGIEDSINACYRQPLSPQLELQVLQMVGASGTGRSSAPAGTSIGAGRAKMNSVASSRTVSSNRPAIPASVVVAVLRRLMLRFLRHTDDPCDAQQQQLHPDVPLSIYCCNPACCRWPWQLFSSSRAAGEEVLEEAFPSGLLLAHTASVVVLLRTLL